MTGCSVGGGRSLRVIRREKSGVRRASANRRGREVKERNQRGVRRGHGHEMRRRHGATAWFVITSWYVYGRHLTHRDRQRNIQNRHEMQWRLLKSQSLSLAVAFQFCSVQLSLGFACTRGYFSELYLPSPPLQCVVHQSFVIFCWHCNRNSDCAFSGISRAILVTAETREEAPRHPAYSLCQPCKEKNNKQAISR